LRYSRAGSDTYNNLLKKIMFMNVISSVIEFYGTCYKLKYIYPGEERVSGGPMICHR
jgi:hypothetical protein